MITHFSLRRVGTCLLAVAMLLVFAAEQSSAAKPDTADSPVHFETQVRPILKAYCFHCHGESKELSGGLDVRLVRSLTKGGETGPALVSGNHKQSLLFEKISSREMPPGEKKLSDADVALIARWIDSGAKTLRPEPEKITSLITDEDREFWSFQPIRRPAVPQPRDAARVQTPIDAFVLAELEKRELSFSREADPATLIRRAYFDLLGLPPTPEEVAEFVRECQEEGEKEGRSDGGNEGRREREPLPSLVPSISPSLRPTIPPSPAPRVSPSAYARLIDRLLADPRYGERWARHWLDVAGYADSDGYTPLDPVRDLIYKYRDYVIRGFNDDKPWNEFIVEQLAGDELVRSPVETPSAADLDKLIATGFLRLGPDGTSDASVDQPVARNDVMAETLKIVSTSLLGLSVGCAQCHNHRYDPIPQSDYYSFRALFEPAYDWKNWRPTKTRLVSTLSAAERKKKTAHEAQVTKLSQARGVEVRKLMDEIFEAELKKVPEEFHALIRKGRSEMPQRRTMEVADLFKKYPGLTVTPDRAKTELPEKYAAIEDQFDKPLEELKKIPQPAEEFVHALTEVPGKVSPTLLFFRGDHNNPRDEVKPAELTVLTRSSAAVIPEDDPELPTTGRRLAYARQLTDGSHPLVARVLVNRFWLHHFGRGIVASPGDFGYLGQRPTHPELLDWLATDFMEHGWTLKRLHRLLMLSATYRQVSTRSDTLDAVDPDNHWLGRMSARRLDAEALRDSVLSVAGNLNSKMFGKPVPVTPNDTGLVVLGVDTRDGAGRFQKPIASLGHEAHRRSLYIQVRRTLPLGVLETFDAPAMTPNCECRNVSTVTPQMLLLMNSEFVLEQSADFAKRLRAEVPDKLDSQLRLGWRIAFGCEPSESQLAGATRFVHEATELLAAAGKVEKNTPSAEQRALALFCQSLLSANAFLYVD